MLWLVLDLALVVLALVGLAAIGLGLWRQASALGREVALVRERLGRAAAGIEDTRRRLEQRAAERPE